MSLTDLFQIDGPWKGRLTISSRPRGGDWLNEELGAWREVGVDEVVSLLTPRESIDLGLETEAAASSAQSMKFRSLPIEDRSVPYSFSEVSAFLAPVIDDLNRGLNVNIHCRQGIGRAPLIAVALLIEQGMNPGQAIQRVSEARGVAIPETMEQRTWIDQFSATLHQPQSG